MSRFVPFRTCMAIVAVALFAGCAGREAGGGPGAVIIGSAQDPGTLFPPLVVSAQAVAVSDLIFDRLALRGPELNTIGDAGYLPRLAQRWAWSADSLQITFHIDPRARWEDGRAVTARDVKFGFAVFTDPVVGSRIGADLREVADSISVADSLTCTAWFRRRSPEQFEGLVMSLTPLPEHLLGRVPHDSLATNAFTSHPVGNGPYRLAKWEQQVRLELAPSGTYAGPRPSIERVIWSFAPDASTLLKQFMAGESDFLENLSPDDAAAAAVRPDLRVVRLGTFSYNFLLFNLRDGTTARPNPLFGDRALRRALTMALDRPLLVRSVFDTLGRVGLGPFVRAQWSADTSLRQIGFDRPAAERTLDSLGWRAGADGVRARGGRALAFTLLVPTSSAARQRYAVLIQEQLRLAGVKVTIEKLDVNAWQDRMRKHQFEASMGGLGASPSPTGVKQSWTSSAAVHGLNFGSYANHVFDAQVESAITSRSEADARAHYDAAYQTIVDDAPAIWLYEPPMLAGANARLHLGPVRADAWWLGIPGWSLAQGTAARHDTPPARAP